MKYILTSYLILCSFLFANPDFVKEESSVFDQKIETVVEEVKQEQAFAPVQNLEDAKIEIIASPVIETEVVANDNINEPINEDSATPLLVQDTESLNHLSENEESTEVAQNSEDSPTQVQENSVESITQEVIAEDSTELLPEDVVSINYYQEVVLAEPSSEKNLYVSFKQFPETIYKNQRFDILVKTLVTTNTFDRVETRFINGKNMIPLNPETPWNLIAENTFENRYFFKAYENDFVLPTLQVLLYKDGEIIEVAYLKPEALSFSEIAKNDEKFSSIIADSLVVKAFKSKQYNNDELITILDIEAYESNLEDFYLPFIGEQGFSKISDNYPEQTMLYYLVMPIHKKKIEFNYYSSSEKRLKKVIIPIQLENELVSTQTDLNPNNSNILFYKKVALGILSALFLGLFIWKRNYLYLIVLLIALIVLILYMMPNRQAFIKGDTTIYILPTKNSTIFYKTQQTRVAEVVMQKAGFAKIMMNVNNKKIIGWIKEERLVKN